MQKNSMTLQTSNTCKHGVSTGGSGIYKDGTGYYTAASV
jgi:hypothetical protein